MNAYAIIVTVFFALLALLEPAQAADAGNVLAGIIGAFLGLVLILAAIGWYARNRA